MQEAKIAQNEVGKLYDNISNIYDLWGNLAESKARSRAIELANIKDGQNILEVACGTGLAFREIVQKNPNGFNHGIDLSEGMLAKAKIKLKNSKGNYELEIGSAFELKFENEKFDILINNYMFDLIPFSDMDKIIIEFKRVLKTNGKLVLVNMTEAETFFSKLYQFIYKISPKTIGGCRGVKLSEKLSSHGFKIEKREYYQQMLFPSEVIVAYKNI